MSLSEMFMCHTPLAYIPYKCTTFVSFLLETPAGAIILAALVFLGIILVNYWDVTFER
jgi:hypothetical protein